MSAPAPAPMVDAPPPAPEVPPTRPAAFELMLAILPLAGAARLWLAWNDQGLFWPDELYQTLEQAHRFAFGYGLVPWEFKAGARSWLLPGAIGLLWKVLDALGIHRSQLLVPLAKTAMVALALLGIGAGMRLARRLAGDSAALFAGVLGATFPPLLVYGSRCTTEMASAPLLVCAALLALDAGRRAGLGAGALLGLAIALRLQNGVVAAGLGLALLTERRYRDAGWLALGALGVLLLASGLLDWVTWGSPFHSAWENFKFNLLEGKAAETFGTSPPSFYLVCLARSVGLWSLVLGAGFLVGALEHRRLGATCAAYFLVHSAIGHKEFRLLMPIAPLALVVAGAGLARLLAVLSVGRARQTVLAGLLAGGLGWRTASARFGDYGQFRGSPRERESAFFANEDANLALWDASERSDLCGILLNGMHPAWQGGYAYLHRDVPMVFGTTPEDTAAANYAVLPAGGSLPGYRPVSVRKNFSLHRRPGGCTPPPGGPKFDLPL